MKHISFHYDSESIFDTLFIKDDRGMKISFTFSDDELLCLEFDGIEIDEQSDTEDSLYFRINGEFHMLRLLKNEAVSQYPGIKEEVRQEEEDEDEHRAYYSNPRLSGRI